MPQPWVTCEDLLKIGGDCKKLPSYVQCRHCDLYEECSGWDSNEATIEKAKTKLQSEKTKKGETQLCQTTHIDANPAETKEKNLDE